jgi:hypothetical protein
MIARIASRPVPPLGPEVPEAVFRVLERAMSKSPEDRPRSALELGLALRTASAESGVAQPEPQVLQLDDTDPRASGGMVELVGRSTWPPAEAEAAPPVADARRTAVITGARTLRVGPRGLGRRGLVVSALAVSLVVGVAALVTVVTTGRGHAATWTLRAPMPTARAWLSVTTAADGRIFAIGGLNGRPLNAVEAYDPGGDRWSAVAHLGTARWAAAAATGPDGRIYAIGGFADRPLDSVEVYTPGGGWTDAAPLTTARWAAAAVTARDGRIYVLGGFATQDDHHALSSVEVYTPATNSWRTVAPMGTARGALAAVAGPDGRIYAIGGANGPDLADVEVYAPETDRWMAAPPLPTARSGLGAGVGPDGRVHAVGGYTDHAIGTVEVYAPGTRRWTAEAPLPVPLFPAVASTPSGGIYVIGGGTDTGGVNTVYTESP